MHLRAPISILLVLLFGGGISHSQTYTDFVFNNPVQSTNNTRAGLGDFYDGSIIDFLNVSPTSSISIDARVTASAVGDVSFEGHYPNYNSPSTDEPNDDLGHVYIANSAGTGGIDYTVEFFVGGTDFATPYVVDDFRFLFYDVDGEAPQSESVTASNDDGLVGFQLPTTDEFQVVQNGDEFTFNGPGVNRAETDPSAAVILYYSNTSSVTFNLRATTLPSSRLPNGVFSAIDGDLSLLGGIDPINDPDFEGFTPTPEPSSAMMLMIGAAGSLMSRNRTQSASS